MFDHMEERTLRIDTDMFRWRSFLVKAWNYSSWPAYKSRFWNKDQVEAQSRKPYVFSVRQCRYSVDSHLGIRDRTAPVAQVQLEQRRYYCCSQVLLSIPCSTLFEDGVRDNNDDLDLLVLA